MNEKKEWNWFQKRIFTKREITLPVALCYGVTDFKGGSITNILSMWLLFFYTTFGGLSMAQAGLLFGIAKIIDAIQTLVAGVVADNFHKTKLGKKYGRRHFLLFLSIPLMFLFVLVWIPNMNFIYYVVTFVVFEMTGAIHGVAYESLPTEMTDSFKDRVKLSTARMWISSLGAFGAAFLPAVLIAHFGKDNASTFAINALIFACLFSVILFITAFNTWEKSPDEIIALEGDEKTSLSEKIKSFFEVLKVKAFRKQLAIFILSFTGKDIFNSLFVYFCVFCMGITSAQAGSFLSLSIVGLGITLIAGYVMNKRGPRVLYAFGHIGIIACIAALCIIYVVRPNHIIIVMFVVALCFQISRVVIEFTPWNVFPFIPDCDLIASKRIRTGSCGAIITFGCKLTGGLAVMIVGSALSHGGFVQGNVATQSIEAQHAILYVLAFGAGGLVLLSLLISLTFRLNRHTHKIIHDEIDRLSNGGSLDDVTSETKEVVEDLTGYEYKNIWGNKNKV